MSHERMLLPMGVNANQRKRIKTERLFVMAAVSILISLTNTYRSLFLPVTKLDAATARNLEAAMMGLATAHPKNGVHHQPVYNESAQTNMTVQAPSLHLLHTELSQHIYNTSTLHNFFAPPPVRPTPVHPVPVVMWPYVVDRDTPLDNAESQHIFVDGVRESPYLTASDNLYDFRPDVVWVFNFVAKINRWDAKRVVHAWDALYDSVVRAVELRRNHSLPETWPLRVVDFSDTGYFQACKRVIRLLGPTNVHRLMRPVVFKRQWSNNTQWVTPGVIRYLHPYTRHAPICVRTDIVGAIEQAVREQHNCTSLRDDIEGCIRKEIDVTHFWPLEDHRYINKSKGQLRQVVTQEIYALAKQHNLSVHLNITGHGTHTGRKKVRPEYVEAMLNSKIIVVTQRDLWEDHYRLFEALVSGSMVMTDRMLSLPRGLANGTSVIEFTSLESLSSYILYYLRHEEERLAVARRGRYVAMTLHRSWHRMEEIVFGDVKSRCPPTDPLCQYQVHAPTDPMCQLEVQTQTAPPVPRWKWAS